MKDAYYFSHDSNARHDPRVLALRSKFGALGYSLFFMTLEAMREESGYGLRVSGPLAHALAFDFGTDADTLKAFYEYVTSEEIGLFVWRDGLLFSPSLLERMERADIIRGKARENAQKRWNKTENDPPVVPPQSDGNASKGKGNENKEKGKGKEPDFLDNLVTIFAEEYKQARDAEYFVSSKEKERAAAAKVLGFYKKLQPAADSQQARDDLRLIFRQALNITSDAWLRQNMSLPILASQFNKVRNVISDGDKQQGTKRGVDPSRMRQIVGTVYRKQE